MLNQAPIVLIWPIHVSSCAVCFGGTKHCVRDDLALPEERRRRMFFAEAQAVVSEQRNAENAKATVQVRFLRFLC